jgi:hypothetical protein
VNSIVDSGVSVSTREPLSGHSAEAAVACGLRAIHNREDLDQHVAITALSESPNHRRI